MNKFTKQQIKDLTYDGQILESDGRISGFIINGEGKEKLKIWTPINDGHYTDDPDYYDKWFANINNITVNKLKSMRLKTKNRIGKYFSMFHKKLIK